MPDALRFALRSLRRSPGFTLIAVVTLGTGIGASTSAFSIVNEVRLRPLPYPDADRLDRIYRAIPQNSRGGVSPADYLDLESQAAPYGAIAAYAFADVNLSTPGEPATTARGLRVSTRLFPILGVAPVLGRDFRPDEHTPGNDRVLLVSHRFWQNRLAGDPHVVGRVLRVDGETHEIVGVLPASMNDWRHLGGIDVFRPLSLTTAETTDRAGVWLRLVGRRAPSVSRAQADGFISAFGRRMAAEYPAVHAASTWRTLPLPAAVAPDNGPGIFAMLLGLSGFVLLIACSNLANLLLTRTMAQARELALRGALGASRVRLLLPLIAESALLALAGGACAVLFGTWTNAWLRTVGDDLVVAMDWRVLGWAFCACVATTLAFGLAPALFSLRLDLNRTLKSSGRGTTGGRGHRRFRHALVVGQFALATMLLGGAALFVHGVHAANTRSYGWSADRVVLGTVRLPASTYPDAARIGTFQRAALERLEALPGVATAAVSDAVPFFGFGDMGRYLLAGHDAPPPGREPVATGNGVSPGYFETVGTRLLAGRVFDERDTLGSPPVLVVNEAMARGLFGAESAIGRRIARVADGAPAWGEIVGVVEDAQSIFPDRVPVPYQVYRAVAQEPRPEWQIAVRAERGAPPGLLDRVRGAIAALDADLPIQDLDTAQNLIAKASNSSRVLGTILSFLAVLGLALASLGIYGVVARTVAQRTGEFGIRMALGAQVSDIVRLVLGSGARLAVSGSAIGIVGAIGVVRLLQALFPALPMSSVPVLGAVTLLLVAIAQVACFVPARHAARISPTETLKAE